MIDERTRAALSRLTENERACLARRLRHQTAKEMAIDLGISPHAVEKRLKMARTKLGVSSSLEAARLLEANEANGETYGRTGPQAPELGGHRDERQQDGDPKPAWRRIAPYALTGVIAMSLAVAALLAVAPLNVPSVATPPVARSTQSQTQSRYLVQLTLKQGEALVASHKLLVAAGQSTRATGTNADGTRYGVSLSVVEREGSAYLVKMDLNSSPAKGRGVHMTPAVLVKAGETTHLTAGTGAKPLSIAVAVAPDPYPVIGSTIKTFKEYEKERERETGNKYERPQMIPAPPETVRAFVNEVFDTADKDHSGYIERAEAPETYAESTLIRKGPMPKPGESRPFPDDNEQVAIMKGPSAQAAYLATMDKDADGKVSREEYQTANVPRFMGWGVPANWHGAPKVAAK